MLHVAFTVHCACMPAWLPNPLKWSMFNVLHAYMCREARLTCLQYHDNTINSGLSMHDNTMACTDTIIIAQIYTIIITEKDECIIIHA